ncbi:MAG TPA: SDR family NAD(P)-dependent oxidoreductase [Lactobacillaceae bacterium]|jgi:NAD(P)-dependent dehydrogenase (short-subunit alcohol dehydrogenase family)
MTEKKVVLITGASNGMGFESAKLFAQNGWIVYAGARRLDKMAPLLANGVHTVQLDVTNHASNAAFVQTALQEQGRIDVLINNAGYGEYGPLEEISLDNARAQLETNLFGAADLAQLVLPTMRAQKNGRIVNISSIGGNLYTPLGGWYHVTKFGLNVWSDVLDAEVAPFGVRSVVVQPGGTESSWGEIAVGNARKNLKPNSPYQQLVNGIGGVFERATGGATSADLAKVFYKAATDQKPKMRYFNAFGDRLTVYVARNHPKIFKFIITQVTKRLSK